MLSPVVGGATLGVLRRQLSLVRAGEAPTTITFLQVRRESRVRVPRVRGSVGEMGGFSSCASPLALFAGVGQGSLDAGGVFISNNLDTFGGFGVFFDVDLKGIFLDFFADFGGGVLTGEVDLFSIS